MRHGFCDIDRQLQEKIHLCGFFVLQAFHISMQRRKIRNERGRKEKGKRWRK
jgi:hypothetical protein